LQLSSKTRWQTKTKIGGKDNPYLVTIEATFQRDAVRGFGEKGILPHLFIQNALDGPLTLLSKECQ